MAAGDTYRAAAGDQLEIWAERTGCEIVRAEKEHAKASAGTWSTLPSLTDVLNHLYPFGIM